MPSLVRSFLGEAALRLQRLLDVDAAVSPRFEPGEKITPVVVVGDGDRPGMGGVRGRRWSAGGGGVMAAGQGVVFKLDDDASPLQLDRVVLGLSATGRLQIQLHVGMAAGVTNSNSFLDRAQGTEAVPGLRMVTPAAGTGLVVGQVGMNATAVAVPLDFLLSPNLGIGFHSVSALTLDCWLLGRSF